MTIPPLGEFFGPKGPSPLAEGQRIAQLAFGEQPEVLPISHDTLLQNLSKPTKVEVQPSYTLAGLAVIDAATLVLKE